jgi:hypothetical protein
MLFEFRRALGAALFLSLCGAASAVLAQEKRPWVDPPPETGATPQEPPVPADAGRPEPAAQTAAPKNAPAGERNSAAQPEKAALAAPEPKRSAKDEAKRTRAEGDVTSTGSLRAPELTASRKKPSVARNARSRVADQTPSGRRIRTVREALAAGLEVRNLRTIELPDGRRITVLTRPDPETMRDLLERPHTLGPP